MESEEGRKAFLHVPKTQCSSGTTGKTSEEVPEVGQAGQVPEGCGMKEEDASPLGDQREGSTDRVGLRGQRTDLVSF